MADGAADERRCRQDRGRPHESASGSQNASTTELNSLLQKASRVASGGNTSVQAKGDGPTAISRSAQAR